MTQMPSAPSGSGNVDPEVFSQVWRRVMPQDRPDCPIMVEPLPTGQQQEAPGSAPAEPAAGAESAEEMLPVLAEEVPTPLSCPLPEPPRAFSPAPAPRHVSPVRPDEHDVPCLGRSSAMYGSALQEFIDHELSDWRTYMALSRRCPAGGNRVLASIAADERRHGKRLSAAYFLISGIRYWPVEHMTAPPQGAWPAALRQRFAGEQQGAAAYLAAAAESSDPALTALYTELAADEARHAQLLRELLEEM